MKSWLIICSIYQATFCKIHILGKKKYSLFNTENHFLRAIILRRNSMIQDVKKMIEMVLQAWRLFSLLLFLLCQKFRHQKLTLSSASNCASHTSRAITLKGHTSLACLPTFLEGWDIQAQVPGNGYFFSYSIPLWNWNFAASFSPFPQCFLAWSCLKRQFPHIVFSI